MPIPTLNRLAARVAGKLPLRTVLIVPFVLQIVGTVGLVGYLSYKNGHQEVSNLATQLQLEINSRIAQHLDSYLAVPSQLNKINVDAYDLKLLNFFNFKSTGQYFWRQLQVFNISYINFATPKGEFIGAGDYGQGSIQIEEIPKNIQGKSYKYDTDKKGNRTRLISVQNFDPHEESWYFNAVKAGKPVWSEIYNWDTNPEIMSIAASYPLYDENKTLIGVTGIDLKLSDISRFLKKIKIGKSGKAFILERSGLLVASSVNEPSFTMVNGKAQRLNAATSHTPAIQLITQYLQKRFGNLNKIQNSYLLNLDLSGQRQYVQVSPWRDQLGLDWLVVVVIPKADFTEQINANTRTTILLCIVALIGSTGIGIITARWITKPILCLNTAAKDIANGEWDKSVEIQRADEVGELANSFNKMAVQLQQSFAELQSLNAALVQSESQLNQFLQALPVGVSIHDATGKGTYFNPTAKRLLGIEIIPDSTSEELAAAYQLYRQNQLYPTEQLPALRALKGETVFLDDIELHRDGKIVPFEVHAAPISDKQGNIIYAIVAFFDITDRKQVEKLLADYNRTLESQVVERTAELTRANEQLQHEKELRETIYNESADAIFLVDPKTRLIIDCNRRAVELFEVTGKEDLIGIQGRTLQRYPYTSEKIEQISIEMYRKGFWNREIEYVTRKGNIFWGNIAGKPVQIAGEAVTLVRITDISDKKLAEQALQASQARFAGILEIANDAIITVDAKQRITLFNQGAEKIFGYRAEEVLGQSLDLLLPAGVREIHHHHVTAFAESVGKARRMGDRSEIFGCRQDGTEFPAEASISKLEINGEKVFTTILRDISERKRAEQALIDSEERFQEIARTISQFFFVRSASSGQFIYASPAYEKIWGRTCESLYQNPQSWMEALHPDDRELVLHSLREQFQGNSVSREYRIIQPDGSIRWVIAYISVVRDDAGQPLRFIGIAEDISDRKRTEQEIRQLSTALENAVEGISRLDTQGRYIAVNTAYADITGYQPEEMIGMEWQRTVHPDEREKMIATYQEMLSTGKVEAETRGIRKDGSMFHKQLVMVTAYDEQNNFIGHYCFMKDITERKQAEEALRRYERIVSATTDAMSLVDRNYIYQVINQTYLTWHNKPYEEIVGYSVSEILGAEVFERVIKEPFDQCLAGETAHYQNWFELAPGRRFLSVTYSPYLEADHTISGVVVSIRDITELKQIEERLWQRNQEMQAIFAAFPDILFRLAADGTILDFKTKNYKNLYTSPEAFLAKKVQEVLPAGAGEKIHAAVRQTLQTESPLSLEYSLPLPEGEQYFEARMVRLHENEVIAVTRNISDRKLAEEALRQSEATNRAILSAIPDLLIWMSQDGTYLELAIGKDFTLFNPAQSHVGTNIYNVLPHPTARQRMEYVQRAIQTGELQVYEHQLIVEGETRYEETRIAASEDGKVLVMVRDITARKRTEAALRESEEQLQLALEGSGDGFWDWNIQTGEVYYSPRYLEMLGYEIDEFIQDFSTWDRLIHPDDKPWVMETLNAHLADSSVPYHFDYRLLTKSGEWQWVANYGKVVARDQNGAPLRMTGTHRDVSDKKLTEIELQQAVLSAEAANRAKSQFLANMSHELRTPLNGILGYAQILQADKNCTPKQKKGVGIIHQCGTHLLTLINDILDLSKIEAGKIELYPEDFHLPSLLTSLSEIFQLKATQKSITFTYLPLNQLPKVIHADQKRLRQVLMNLLSNAVKFTDAGSVTFKVEVIGNGELLMNSQNLTPLTPLPYKGRGELDSPPLRGEGQGEGSAPSSIDQTHLPNSQLPITKIRFQVEDTGIGIPSEQLEKIFLPFEQVGDISRCAEGTGLGLAITQKILELMEGKIVVESTPGVGSRFWLDLDVPVVSMPMKSTPVKLINNIIGYSGEKRKILIVDDRWENRTILINMLEAIGFELKEAADGQEGLEKAIECQPDLILADLVMPVMDGYQMTLQLRELPEFQNTIIIAISANAFAVDRQKSLESGCNDFLPKPVQSEDLLEKIKSYLNLSWTYNSQSEAQSHKLGDELSRYPQVERTEMVIPPKEELLALYEAADSGFVSGVKREAIRLQQLNPDYTPFATRILELAADFEYEEIVKLIDRYLS